MTNSTVLLVAGMVGKPMLWVSLGQWCCRESKRALALTYALTIHKSQGGRLPGPYAQAGQPWLAL